MIKTTRQKIKTNSQTGVARPSEGILVHLEWFLPVVLELLQVVLGTTPSVSHPPKPISKEFTNVTNPVIIQVYLQTLKKSEYLFDFRLQ